MPGEFPHLNLLEVRRGPARLTGFRDPDERAAANRANRPAHSGQLLSGLSRVTAHRLELTAQRELAGLPAIPGGMPFLVQVTDSSVLEFLAKKLGIEVVAEYSDGFVIVATQDVNLAEFQAIVREFEQSAHGSGLAASVLAVFDDGSSEERVRRILTESLHPQWPLPDGQIYILEVSVQTAGLVGSFGSKPVEPRKNEQPEQFAARLHAWEQERDRTMAAWEEVRMQREAALESLVRAYQGEFLTGFIDSIPAEAEHFAAFPDSFSARIRMSGKGFKDLVQNFPNLFEVAEPDELIGAPALSAATATADTFELTPPDDDAPTVCVVDSGIQEGHRWLAPAIDAASSRCFLPGVPATEVADLVRPGGHGTRVAGAVLYPREVPKAGTAKAVAWLQNARILDAGCLIPDRLFPALALQQVVAHFHGGPKRTRIFNHSVGASQPCRLNRMSVWAAEIDLLSYREDVLFIQAAGNISGTSNVPGAPGVSEHLAANRAHPAYLLEASSRISNPAQSLQALTVGSVALATFRGENHQSLAEAEHPSAFSRSGLGMWSSIKPEVVEIGGDYARDAGQPPRLSFPPEVCPELVRSTLHEPTAGYAADEVGTSYAAPKVAHLACHLQVLFPTHSALLYRALIVHSARWPAWTVGVGGEAQLGVLKTIGYGLPDLARATENTEHRVTLITDTVYELEAGEAAVFSVPIPAVIRRPGLDRLIRVDVTLSYSAEARRTRKARTGYLSTWLDWISSRRRETEESFRRRAFTDTDENVARNGDSFGWVLEKRPQHGDIVGASRDNGTVQRDWAFVPSYDLPEVFCVAVRGHAGWAGDAAGAKARFVLVVSFEAVNADVPIYVPVQAEIEAARVRQEVQV